MTCSEESNTGELRGMEDRGKGVVDYDQRDYCLQYFESHDTPLLG